ncbi:MAG: hypothetical protein RL138_1303 [Bacteroidota bacterium]|jgi:VanZ family protein
MGNRKVIPFLLWAILIAILSLMPTDKLPDPKITNFDKAVHLTMYGILSLLACYGLANESRKRFFTIALFSASYGFGLECCQGLFCTYRSFDWWDAVYNCLGAILGVVLFLIYVRIRKKKD